MVIFILAAAVSYLLLASQTKRDGEQPSGGAQESTRWQQAVGIPLRHHGHAILAAILALMLGFMLTASLAGPFESHFLLTVQRGLRRLASAPETASALLGAIAGILCHAYPGWSGMAHHSTASGQKENVGPQDAPVEKKGDGEASTWPMVLFLGAIAGIVLTALAAPQAPALLDRLSGVEVSNVKVQFATSPAEQQLALTVDRDLFRFDKLEDFSRSFRFIQYACGQAALEAGGITPFTSSSKYSSKYEEFQKAIAFRQWLSAYVNYIIDYQRHGRSLELLRHRMRPLAQMFEQLVSNPIDVEEHFARIKREIEKETMIFRATGLRDADPPEEERRRRRDKDPDWCKPYDKELKGEDVKQLINGTRYVHGFASGLYSFLGDIEGDIRVAVLGKRSAGRDINAASGLAASLYLAGRDLGEVLHLLDVAMERIEENDETARKFKATPGSTEEEIQRELQRRHARARFIGKMYRGYLWAQKGLQETWPQEEVPWGTALNYAEDVYHSFHSIGDRQFPCTDDDWDLRVHDIYAFVTLAFEVHNLRAHKIKPNQTRVRDARMMLESTRVKALNIYRDLKGHRDPREAASTCLNEGEASAWMKRISSHLKLAEALLR